MKHDNSKEQKFWAWFKQREEMLFNFERDQERIFDKLDEALSIVSPRLTFEFGTIENGAREFVISADGVKAEFATVEALAAAAPALPQWKIVKFRHRSRCRVRSTFDPCRAVLTVKIALCATSRH